MTIEAISYFTHTHTHTHTHAGMHMHTHTCMHAHMHACTHAHAHTHAYMHTHARTHARTHTHHFLGRFLSVHESLGDDSRCEYLVALTELLEENTVGKTETADSDSLQHSVAAQLIEDKVCHYLASLLLVVGNDATDKVWLGGAEGAHQVVELFLSEGGEGEGRERVTGREK